jgi:hypothetical protein
MLPVGRQRRGIAGYVRRTLAALPEDRMILVSSAFVAACVGST